ncbi:MAG: hypothetical protein HYU86_01515 [Chloroflexi bacterium]|nr:hypothetical protein [Chloroflexota bacterium]
MKTSIQVHSLPSQNGKGPILLLRNGRPVAILSEGDPLRRTLTLSLRELRAVVAAFPHIMKEQPRVKRIMEALIQLREEEARAVNAPG